MIEWQSSSNPAWAEQLSQWENVAVLLLGEQHDAPEHHAWEAETARLLAQRQHLAALVLEMADAGAHTRSLNANASEEQVQQSLNWNDKGWPWQAYGPTVMAAVRANVPVLGGNLPRSQMRDAMKNEQLDHQLSAKAMQLQIDAIKQGHCDLLPESQLLPMARIQLAKDESMAKTIQSVIEPGKTVLLIAGNGHVRKPLGIPRWLPADISTKVSIGQAGKADHALISEADVFLLTPALPPKDHCAELRKQWKK